MFIPIGDDNVKGGYKPIFSYLLIASNIALFGYELSLGEELGAFLDRFAFTAYRITHFQDMDALFTSMFLHGGWMHLIGNMMFLWVFGDNIEAVIGNFKFIFFYLLGGIIAGLSQVFLFPEALTPTLGASGAIAAVLGAYLIMFPASRIKILFFVFTFSVPAILFLGFWIFQQFSNGYGALSSTADTGGVAWWAHIGGFVFGLISGIYYRVSLKTTVEHYV
ncbi:MAG: rhomboid family intramembrane serine protease [Saprospiraceae bacterium]